jgi:hypothetical protein
MAGLVIIIAIAVVIVFLLSGLNRFPWRRERHSIKHYKQAMGVLSEVSRRTEGVPVASAEDEIEAGAAPNGQAPPRRPTPLYAPRRPPRHLAEDHQGPERQAEPAPIASSWSPRAPASPEETGILWIGPLGEEPPPAAAEAAEALELAERFPPGTETVAANPKAAVTAEPAAGANHPTEAREGEQAGSPALDPFSRLLQLLQPTAKRPTGEPASPQTPVSGAEPPETEPETIPEPEPAPPARSGPSWPPRPARLRPGAHARRRPARPTKSSEATPSAAARPTTAAAAGAAAGPDPSPAGASAEQDQDLSARSLRLSLAGNRGSAVAAVAALVVVVAGAATALAVTGGRPTTPLHRPGIKAHRRAVAPTTTTTTTSPPLIQPTAANAAGATYRLPAGQSTVTFSASGACWILVQSAPPPATGPVLFEGTLQANQTKAFSASGSLWIRLGWPAHAALKVNGVPVRIPASGATPFNLTFGSPGAASSA